MAGAGRRRRAKAPRPRRRRAAAARATVAEVEREGAFREAFRRVAAAQRLDPLYWAVRASLDFLEARRGRGRPLVAAVGAALALARLRGTPA